MTLTRTTDHETALAAGFDIVRPGEWVRPDNAALSRYNGRYIAHRDVSWGTKAAAFYTMAEAVAWVGATGAECCGCGHLDAQHDEDGCQAADTRIGPHTYRTPCLCGGFRDTYNGDM